MMHGGLRKTIIETLGDEKFGEARHEHLNRLAEAMMRAHWHVADLPWNELPPLPVPDDVSTEKQRAYVQFGMRAIDAQLAAEHVAVSTAHLLLRRAEEDGLNASARRALAALLNDEASHVEVMTELRACAEQRYQWESVGMASPLFQTFLRDAPAMHPAAVAIFMGAYEAMIAIRSYAEQASYRRPSVLGRVAELAGHDDGRHAKVLRLVADEWLDVVRRDGADEPDIFGRAVVEPLRALWPLLLDHELALLRGEPHSLGEWKRRVRADAAIVDQFLQRVGVPNEHRRSVDLIGAAATHLDGRMPPDKDS